MMRHLGLDHLSDPDSPSFDPTFASLELEKYALTTGDCDCVFACTYESASGCGQVYCCVCGFHVSNRNCNCDCV